MEFVDHDGFECVVYWMRVSADVGMRCDMELPTWVEVMDPLRPAEHVSLGDGEAREQSHSQQYDRSWGK